MKYITRIDHKNTHCYWVRVGYGIKQKVQKSFTDKTYGGTVKAFMAAKKWRNEQVKKLLPVMAKEYKYDKNGQRYWGKGWREYWQTKGDYEYLFIVAWYSDSKNGRQLKKTFSVNKYGYDKAVALAKQWRKHKITGKL